MTDFFYSSQKSAIELPSYYPTIMFNKSSKLLFLILMEAQKYKRTMSVGETFNFRVYLKSIWENC